MFFFDKNNVMLGLVCFMFAGIGFYGSRYFIILTAKLLRKKIWTASAKGLPWVISAALLQWLAFVVVVMKKTLHFIKDYLPAGGCLWVVFANSIAAYPTAVIKRT
jgi:hypothetical protein